MTKPWPTVRLGEVLTLTARGETPLPGVPPDRAVMVVPNGTLFGDGVCARIKEELLKK